MNILFVCTANICRSFMAERILKGKIRRKTCGITAVRSAGLSDVMEGMPGDPQAVTMLTEKGFDGTGHTARLLTADMVAEADMIIGMEKIHLLDIINQYPDADGKTFLLKSLAGSGPDDEDIKDPYGLSIYHYRLCFADIYMAIEELVKKCTLTTGD